MLSKSEREKGLMITYVTFSGIKVLNKSCRILLEMGVVQRTWNINQCVFNCAKKCRYNTKLPQIYHFKVLSTFLYNKCILSNNFQCTFKIIKLNL